MSRTRRLAIAALGLASLLGAVHAQAAAPITFTTPVGLQNGGGGEPSVATDGQGTVIVGAPQGTGGGEGDYWVSHDDGATWPSKPKLLGSLHGGSDEDVAFAPADGSSFANQVYISDLAVTYSTVCTSTNHGDTFSTVGPVPDQFACSGEEGSGSVGPSSDREWLTADRNGRAYLTYHEFNTAQPLAYTTANGGADGFVTPCGSIIGANDPLIEQYVPTDVNAGTLVSKPVVDSQGTLYILFTTTTQQENAGAAPNVSGTFSEAFLAVSTDHCATFNDYTIYDGYNSNLPCQAVPRCNAVQFGDIFNDLTIDPQGNLYAIAAGFIDNTAPTANTADIYLFTSPAASHGQTWSQPIKVNTDSGAHMMPAAAAGLEPGQLAVGYFRTINGVTDPNDSHGVWTYTVAETSNALNASPSFQFTDLAGSGSTKGTNVWHIGDICNSGVLCDSGLPGTGTDRSLADFTSAAMNADGCPFFSFAANPGGDTGGNFVGLGASGTTLNYVTKQTGGCFVASPVNTPEVPWTAALAVVGCGVAIVGVRRRRRSGDVSTV